RLLDKFNPSYHFVEGNDSFTDAVNDFLEEKGAQIVISVAQHKNFFQKLFMGSHTRNLAFHTKIPLLVMHQ
ncbi:universal stress protein, partial [Vibrio parahaemolyticus]